MSEPGALTLTEEERRILAIWAADCARHVLPLFEALAPADTRPRDAIEGVLAFSRGELRVGPVRVLSAAAHGAARAVGARAAGSAARAAGHAARAAGHAAGTAHMGIHARGAAAYAALAAGLASPHDPRAAATELRWALDHLTPDVTAGLRRLPPPARTRSPLGVLLAVLHATVEGQSGGI